jgi:hypothetical protein
MTTFTSDDRKNAYDPGLGCVTPSSATGMEEPDLVAEAPYHPGYEDAVIDSPPPPPLSKEITELFEYKKRHINTSKKIIEFLRSGCVWER